MSTKALLAVALAALIPLISFLVLRSASEGAIDMPGRFFYDSVEVKMQDGKQVTDTIWHKVDNISLTNQLGKSVSLDSLMGKVIVADFFFTHCPNICPALTHNMKQLQDAIKQKGKANITAAPFVHFVSFTVDPARDTAAALKRYADKFGADPDIWWMLTGDKKKIYDFALNELKMGIADSATADSTFIHTQKMVLLDKDHVVRGYYDGLDSTSLAKLAKDIVFIMLEKDKNSKSVFAQMIPVAPILVFAIIAIVVVIYFLSRPNKKYPE
ncbi:MAG: SCO family protein [Bacteroidetes bacterium]|nr:SCO family protein [Bacteroidota bacterium]MBS1974330.1 SCO family protein [Bacteroidota bacterium]